MKTPSPFSKRRTDLLSSEFEIIHYVDENFKDVAYHYHDFFEIYFFISGKINYHVNGVIYTPKPGDIILLNNRTFHRMSRTSGESSNRYERRVILIDPDFILDNPICGKALSNCFAMDGDDRSRLLRLDPDKRKQIDEIMAKLVAAYACKNYGDDLLRVIYLLELLVHINKAKLEQEDKTLTCDISNDAEINFILEYLNNNIEGDLSLDAIADELSLDKYYLIRKFNERMGLSPHQYIKQIRLVKARDLLKKEISVTDVCFQCGFNDYSNFIRSFKQNFGVSPKQFTKRYLAKKYSAAC